MGLLGYFQKRGPEIPEKIALKGPRLKAVWEKHAAGEIDIQEAYRLHKAIDNETSLPDIARKKQEEIDAMFENINPRARSKPR